LGISVGGAHVERRLGAADLLELVAERLADAHRLAGEPDLEAADAGVAQAVAGSQAGGRGHTVAHGVLHQLRQALAPEIVVALELSMPRNHSTSSSTRGVMRPCGSPMRKPCRSPPRRWSADAAGLYRSNEMSDATAPTVRPQLTTPASSLQQPAAIRRSLFRRYGDQRRSSTACVDLTDTIATSTGVGEAWIVYE
jgi:hypothetical protein